MALATDYNIDAEPLASPVEIAVTRRQAEKVAIQRSDGSAATNIDSMLVGATATAYGKERADGTLDLIISNRALWLVLVPDQQVPVRGPGGPPFTYSATLAVLIDANSGAFLTSAALAE